MTTDIQDFGEVEKLSVTMVVDNMTDMLLKSTESVRRYTQESGEPLLAEHGLSAIINLDDEGKKILWDAGITDLTLIENMRRMNIDAHSIDCIALSHGHPDHIMAMTRIIKEVAGIPAAKNWDEGATSQDIEKWTQDQKVPLITHPAAFRERWKVFPDGTKYGPMITPREEWEAAGAEIITSKEPYKLADGCWLTGYVPRISFEKGGTPPIFAYRQGDEFVRDYVEDDQAIVVNVREKGLVIIPGCAHAGILNTVQHAKKISGVEKVWAIIGGFHLISSSMDDIQTTIDEIKKLKPEMVVPTHCTGFPAVQQFANQMPEQFVLGVVGTTYLF